MTRLPPVRREIDVPVDPALAFDVFTRRIDRWWPLGEHGVFGAGATVAFEDGQIVERSPSGEPAVWGTVTQWEPGVRVAFTWHPGRSGERPSQVEVTFTAIEHGTRVRLVHTGWEVFADPPNARRDYDENWPRVLEHFGEAAAAGQAPTPGAP